MKLTLRLLIKEPKKQFKVDKSFKTRSIITKRTVEVSEAFGIGVDEERTFTVFKDFVVNIDPGDVVYITGDSGGGKSILLRELAEQMKKSKEFGEVLTDAEVETRIDPEEVLIEGVGKDTNEAINLLSMAGLSDAFLFLRKYGDLSDGQKCRYRIAKMLDRGGDTWVFDEFCATLDRTTAKVVAYCLQKTARRWKKTVLAATTHTDLLEDYNPSLHVEKRFGSDVESGRLDPQPKAFSLLDEVIIREGRREEFRGLEGFHYRGKLPPFMKRIYIAELQGEVVGGIVYTLPSFALRGRHISLPQYRISPIRARIELLNRDFLRIARVVVLPKYRSVGLGVKLVQGTATKVGVPYVEVLAVMAKYNPFFEKAGFGRVYDPREEESQYSKTLSLLARVGMNVDLIRSKSANLEALRNLDNGRMDLVLRVISDCFAARHLASGSLSLWERAKNGDREAMAEALTKVPLPAVYLIWKNPAFENYPDPFIPRREVQEVTSRGGTINSALEATRDDGGGDGAREPCPWRTGISQC